MDGEVEVMDGAMEEVVVKDGAAWDLATHPLAGNALTNVWEAVGLVAALCFCLAASFPRFPFSVVPLSARLAGFSTE